MCDLADGDKKSGGVCFAKYRLAGLPVGPGGSRFGRYA